MTSRPPSSARRWLPGTGVLAFRRDPLGTLQRLAAAQGDVAVARFGTSRVFLLSHPDLIRDVLVTHNRLFMKGVGLQRAKRLLGEGLLTSEGDFHLRQRRLAQPAFHHARVAAYGTEMVKCAEAASEGWSSREGPIDVHADMMRLALAIVGRTLFGTAVEDAADEISRAMTTSMALFQSFSSLPFAALLERLPLPATRRFAGARARLDAVVYEMIAARRADPADRGDLLSMLLLAQDDDAARTRMSDLQLRDEVMTIFLAGHETTANTLAWTWYLLAKHPEVERRLHAEVDALGSVPLGAGALPRLSYTSMVVSESMRLFPPAWVIGRRALAPYHAGGHAIPEGSIVLLSPYVVHRDARWYPDPERFDPDRWAPDARAGRPRFAYFPFGGGTRICIGEQFAMMEAVLVLATLAGRWRLRLHPPHVVEPVASITLRPRNGIPMHLERR